MGAAARVIGSLGAAALLVAGCTSGDGEQGLVAGGDGAEAVVVAALDAAQSGTGRLAMSIEIDETAMREAAERVDDRAAEAGEETGFEDGSTGWVEEDWEMDPPSFSGVYSGEDFLVSADGEDTFTTLQVAGRQFSSVDSMIAPYSTNFGGLADELEFDGPEPPAIPDGVEWVEVDPRTGGSIGAGFAVRGADEGLHLVTSDQLRGIVEEGPSDVDGATTRYRASLDGDARSDLLGQTWGADEAEDDAFHRYYLDHTTVAVEIHLAEDERLVRLAVTITTAVEPEYADCMMLVMAGSPTTVVADYSEPGTEVDIAEPPAASIMSEEDFDDLVMASFDAWVPPGVGAMPNGPSDLSFDSSGEPIKLQTAAGERYRGDIEDDLTKFGSVIDLDPATVAGLDDATLVDAHDRAAAAIAALPRTTTAMGELTRVELLWNVRWGLETLGVDTPGLDAAGVDAMSDAQLAALIDGYVDQNGVWGDGIWGDGPMSLAETQSAFADDEPVDPEDSGYDEEDDEFAVFSDMFEGCPS